MSEKKKSDKAGKKAKSNQGMVYKAMFSRYFNKLKNLKKYVKDNPNDKQAAAWLKFMQGTLAMNYTRGAEAVRAAHKEIYG